MYLAFMHCFGVESEQPELCLIPDKGDQFSCPVRVETVRLTDAALFRLSPEESVAISLDESDGGVVFEAVKPGRIYLTPNLHQNPGVSVKRLKIVKKGPRAYETYYVFDKDGSRSDDWQRWDPKVAIR